MEIATELLRKTIFVSFVIGFAIFMKYDRKYWWLYREQYAAIRPSVWRKKIKDFDRKRILTIALLVVFGLLIMWITIPLFTQVAEGVTGQPFAEQDNMQTVLWNISPWVLLAIASLLPIFEEWIFRGILLERLRRWRKVKGLILSALIFGAIHLSNAGYLVAGAVPGIVAGLILGAIYLKEGLLASVAAHFSWNFINVLIAMIATGVI